MHVEIFINLYFRKEKDELSKLQNQLKDCNQFKKSFITKPINREEEEFPLAFRSDAQYGACVWRVLEAGGSCALVCEVVYRGEGEGLIARVNTAVFVINKTGCTFADLK